MIYADDLAYVHHAGFGDYARRAAPELTRLLSRRAPFSPARRGRSLVVEFGCGGGTTAAYLSDRGFSVLGVDQSPAMVKLVTSPGAAPMSGRTTARCSASLRAPLARWSLAASCSSTSWNPPAAAPMMG
jgi:SAM-dependent methyltransferase